MAPLVAGGLICLLAAVLLAGGGWALWIDRVDRDSRGFVTIGDTELHTDTYAIVSELRADGPRWLYGSTVVGTARVRATSQTDHQLFVGIARTKQVDRYLEGRGFATIEHLESGAVSTHEGRAPSASPTETSIWAASTRGSGRQTLLWKPRDGDWSVVFMNANADAGVGLRGDLSAKAPLLLVLAGVLLLAGALIGILGGLLIVRTLRRSQQSS